MAKRKSSRKVKTISRKSKFVQYLSIFVIVVGGLLYSLYQNREKPGINLVGNYSSNAPSITPLSNIAPVKEYFNNDIGTMEAELTPWALGNHKLGGDYLYLVSSFNTYICSTPNNIFNLDHYESMAQLNTCSLRQKPTVNPDSPTNISDNPVWRRDFYGAFSGHFVDTVNAGLVIYAINHGELLNNNYFPSQPCRSAPDIGYGKTTCDQDPNRRQISYNAFVGMSILKWDLPTYQSNTQLLDYGPIVWPSNGYVKTINGQGSKATDMGVLHPTSIIKDGYIYVFYVDTSIGSEVDGRGPGIKVARSEVLPTGIWWAGFKTYYNGAFTDSALPAGFVKENIHNYFNKQGGRSTALFKDVNTFSVAKVNGTQYYLGVGNDLVRGITLRLSTDLLTWTDPYVVPGTEYNFLANPSDLSYTPFLYAHLANADGDSSNDIDPSGFYVLGTTLAPNPFGNELGPNPYRKPGEAKVVNSIKLKLNL